MNVWQRLERPFYVLAPMDDVTDTVFRRIVAKTAPPDMFFTEFANADGLYSPGRGAVEHKLLFTPEEQPLIAQIWGKDPRNYRRAAEELADNGFAGIDINMGCPVRAVVKNGCCSALINDRILASELIAAAKDGAGGRIPVSVKTRLGFDGLATEDWCGWLLEQGIDALTVHGRIAAQQSKYPADWGEISKVVSLRNRLAPDTVIIGNGDVVSREQGDRLARDTGVDGIMIGRGIFQDPWIFSQSDVEGNPEARISLLLEHLDLWLETWGEDKNFQTMKKFFKMYISGWSGSADLRTRLMECDEPEVARKLLIDYRSKLPIAI